MSTFITTAANLLHSRYTGSIRPYNDSEDQIATLELPRERFEEWIIDEANRTRCKFNLCISGPIIAMNKRFIEKYGEHNIAGDYVAPAVEDDEGTATEYEQVTSVGSKRRRGRPVVDNYRAIYKCNRNAKPLETEPSSSSATPLPRGKAHIGCGCLAKIEVSSLGPNPKTVQVVYHFKHNGHVPGSLNDLRVVGLSDGLKSVIYNLVDQNLTWVNIKHLIRLDRSRLASILNGETTDIPEAMRVSYNTVYYAVKKCMERRANLDEHQRGMYLFAFMSRWQLNELISNCSVVYMDSTHDTCTDDTHTTNGKKRRCYLFTLVCRCATTGKGAPLAWMITNSENQFAIQFWLQWLKDEHGFYPRQFMVDNSNTEIAGIRAAFGESMTILLCHWHVLKGWKANVKMKVKVMAGVNGIARLEIHARRDVGLSKMKKMMHAKDEAEYDMLYLDFQSWCQDDQGIWDSAGLLDYFGTHYDKKKTLWSSAWRQNHSDTNTNNYVESWHRSLKMLYLQSGKTHRMDILVYILWDLVLPDVMADHVKAKTDLQRRTQNRSEKRRHDLALPYTIEGAPNMIINQTLTTIDVISFTVGPDLFYTITLDQQNNIMLACTCLDQLQHGHNCKHMYLINMLEGIALKPMPPLTAATQSRDLGQAQPNEDVLLNKSIARLQSNTVLYNQQMAKVTASRYTTDATNVINEVAEQIAASTNALKRVERTNINRHHQPRHY